MSYLVSWHIPLQKKIWQNSALMHTRKKIMTALITYAKTTSTKIGNLVDLIVAIFFVLYARRIWASKGGFFSYFDLLITMMYAVFQTGAFVGPRFFQRNQDIIFLGFWSTMTLISIGVMRLPFSFLFGAPLLLPLLFLFIGFLLMGYDFLNVTNVSEKIK